MIARGCAALILRVYLQVGKNAATLTLCDAQTVAARAFAGEEWYPGDSHVAAATYESDGGDGGER